MKKILALLIILSFVCGCSLQTKFTYPLDTNIRTINKNPPNVKIAVLPTKDGREIDNNVGTWFLYMVPLMPYGWVDYNRPESATMFFSITKFDCNISEDIAKAIADHFQQAGVAKTVFFDYGGLADTADYTLHSTIKNSIYKGKMYSYCLSVFGPCLWIFGLPAGQSRVDLEINLELKDKQGNVVWNDILKGSWKTTQGMYYNMGRDMEGLARSLQQSLDYTLTNNPMPLK